MSDNSIEYAKMIEFPHTSCEYVFKRKKRFFNKKTLVKSVNEQLKQQDGLDDLTTNASDDCALGECEAVDKNELVLKRSDKREKLKSNLITAQIIAVFALSVAIILTNVFWENSGINQLFKNVFATEKVQEDNRSYGDFSLNLPVKGEGVTLLEGVLNIEGEYSVYPICEGKVSKVEKAGDGTLTVTIVHSNLFSSVIEGADFVYFQEGESVSQNLPVCHTSGSARVYLYEKGSLLTDYATVENSIVFNK